MGRRRIDAIGFGGDAIVSSATGLARQTIRNGRHELAQGVTTASASPGRALDLLVEPLTRGDPMSPLRWTCKSAAKLAGALTAQGWPVSATTVGKLLDGLGYRLHALQKAREGAAHPDRNAQFEHINATAAAFIGRGQPVISVDTKKNLGVGDSGTGERPGPMRLYAQRLDTFNGKILRIIPMLSEHASTSTVSENGRYRIPTTTHSSRSTARARKSGLWACAIRTA